MSDDRHKIAYETFVYGCRDKPCPAPVWDDAPAWVRDLVRVAYIQGALDAPYDRKPSGSDLVDRLLHQRNYWPPDDQALFVEAGVEIERLRNELSRKQ